MSKVINNHQINRGIIYSKVLLSIIIAFMAYSFLTLTNYVPLINFILGSLVIFLGIIPSIIYLKNGMEETIPLMPLTGLFYAFSFGLVGFENVYRNYFISQEAIRFSLYLALGGILSLYLGYYVVGQNLFKNIKPLKINAIISKGKLSFYGWLLEIMYMAYLIFFKGENALTNLDQLIFVVSLLGKGLLFYLFLKGAMSKKEIIFFLVLAVIEFLMAFASGLLALVISLAVFYSVIYLFVKKRIPIIAVVFVLIFFFLFQSVKSEYRDYTWGNNYSDMSLKNKVELFTKLLVSPSGYESENASKLALAFQRIDHLGTTALVVMKTPSIIPYLDGESLKPLLTKFIPRFLWPKKPQETFGNEWAKWYDLLNRNDYTTSYNLPWLTEFYMNFGPIGVFAGMLMVGVLFNFLVIKFCTQPSNILDALLGIILTINLFVQESNISLVLGGIIVLYIPLYLSIKFIAQSRVKIA